MGVSNKLRSNAFELYMTRCVPQLQSNLFVFIARTSDSNRLEHKVDTDRWGLFSKRIIYKSVNETGFTHISLTNQNHFEWNSLVITAFI